MCRANDEDQALLYIQKSSSPRTICYRGGLFISVYFTAFVKNEMAKIIGLCLGPLLYSISLHVDSCDSSMLLLLLLLCYV